MHTQNYCYMFFILYTEPAMPETTYKDENTSVKVVRIKTRARLFQITFLSATIIYVFMAVLARFVPYYGWDLKIAQMIQSISIPGFYTLMIVLSALGSGWLPFALVGAVGLGLIVARFRIEGLVLMCGLAMSATFNQMLKVASARPRPTSELVNIVSVVQHNSFPSGHTVFFVVFFGFLLFLTYVLRVPKLPRRILLFIFSAFILLIGVSRIYLGAHWFSDILGGYLIGSLWLMLITTSYSRLKVKYRKSELSA
jgi:membrane-associated phospholipid phosphatase